MPSMYKKMKQFPQNLLSRRCYRHTGLRVACALVLLVIILHLFSATAPPTTRRAAAHRHDVTQRELDHVLESVTSRARRVTSSSPKVSPVRLRSRRVKLRRASASPVAISRRPMLSSSVQPSKTTFALCEDAERRRTPAREPLTWQPVAARNVTVFSAFVDRRRDVGGPLVRVVASGLQAAFNDVGRLYCRMWFAGSTAAVVSQASYELIYPSTLHASMWVAHFILCPFDDGGEEKPKAPKSVSIVDRPCNSTASNVLLVLDKVGSDPASSTAELDRPRLRPKHPNMSFALCLPALYGQWSSSRTVMLIEWIELHALLGVSEIILYDKSSSPAVRTLLQSYVDDAGRRPGGGLRVRVTVVPWRFPTDKLVDYFNQHEALNDCVYRAALRHRYVAVSDLDEVLMPRRPGGWPRFVADMAGDTDVGAFLFQHAYFRRNVTMSRVAAYLVTMQSLWRTDVVSPPGNIRSKTLYDTEKVLKVNIHAPYKLVPDAHEMIVNPEDGMLHHYRSEPMESFVKHPERYRFVEDRIMVRYADALEAAVKLRLQRIT